LPGRDAHSDGHFQPHGFSHPHGLPDGDAQHYLNPYRFAFGYAVFFIYFDLDSVLDAQLHPDGDGYRFAFGYAVSDLDGNVHLFSYVFGDADHEPDAFGHADRNRIIQRNPYGFAFGYAVLDLDLHGHPDSRT
jgi:hypothetical protein